MNQHLMNEKLSEDHYEDYIEKITNIFRMSNKNKSILFHLELKDSLSIVNQEGQKEEFTDVVIPCNQNFHQLFLASLVERMKEVAFVEMSDVLPKDENGFVTFRIITKNNDLFTISGLSEEDGESLLHLVEETKEIPQPLSH